MIRVMKIPSLTIAMILGAAFFSMAEEAKPLAAPPAAMKNVTPDEAEKLLKEHPKTLVLDVRTTDEFSKGHIPGAKNVDFLGQDFAAKAARLDPGTPILVHCASGKRSTQALEALKDRPLVYHLQDGFKAWEKAGKPVEK